MDTLDPRSPSSRPRLLVDAALALALAALTWVQVSIHPGFVFIGRGGGGERFAQGIPPIFAAQQHTSGLTFVLVGLAFLPLALRRVWPAGVLVVTSVAVAAYQWLPPQPPAFVVLGALVALYTAGTLLDRRRLLMWGVPAGLLILASSLPPYYETMFWPDLVRVAAMLLFAAAWGDATRNRRAYVAEVERRAAEAERTRDEEARRRVDEERLRIARELHDVTAHSLSVIAVQSGAAAHVLDTDPAQARRSLEAIRATSRDALQELRAMLGVLRGSDDEGAPLSPTPGLAGLPDLVKPLEGAGFTVDLQVDAGADDIPALVEASAFRIVQEALTNALRHAGPTLVRVRVASEEDALLVSVEDDGGAKSGEDVLEGHGVPGMRERVAALGGTFSAGPRASGGWRVEARLPFRTRPAARGAGKGTR